MSIRNPGTPREARSWGTQVELAEGVKAFVGVQEVPATGQVWGKVELNPSKLVAAATPGRPSLCAPDEVHRAVERALDEASSLLVPAVREAGEMRVRRLDVARDFTEVERPEYLVRGLAPVHRPWARKNLVHFDPARQGAQTLMVGSKSGVVRLYDKDAETGGQAPGVLRWEAECRDTWCSKYGAIATLGDVDEDRVVSLGRNRWEWSAMHTEVTAMESVVEKVMRSDLSYAEQRGLLGYLLMIAAGADVRAASHTHAKYRSQGRKLGIAIEPGSMSDDSPGFSARLDLDSGRMVCHVG